MKSLSLNPREVCHFRLLCILSLQHDTGTSMTVWILACRTDIVTNALIVTHTHVEIMCILYVHCLQTCRHWVATECQDTVPWVLVKQLLIALRIFVHALLHPCLWRPVGHLHRSQIQVFHQTTCLVWLIIGTGAVSISRTPTIRGIPGIRRCEPKVNLFQKDPGLSVHQRQWAESERRM